uniref:Tetraspanin n=1 Tax=Mesocestoides corti TaxID=53468 RepID=A0A5K3FNZ1_MESCO
MGVSCGTTCLKIFIFVYCITTIIFGAMCDGIGIHLLLKSQHTSSYIPVGSFILIVVAGSLVIVIGILGIIGAWKESKCTLYSFSVGAAILLVIEFGAAIFVFIGQGQFVNTVGTAMRSRITQVQASGLDATDPTIDAIQAQLKCCGGFGPNEYAVSPGSCCEDGQRECRTPYQVGCAQVIYNELQTYVSTVGVIAVILCLLGLGVIIGAFRLAHKMKDFE